MKKHVGECTTLPSNLGEWCDKTAIKHTIKFGWNVKFYNKKDSHFMVNMDIHFVKCSCFNDISIIDHKHSANSAFQDLHKRLHCKKIYRYKKQNINSNKYNI